MPVDKPPPYQPFGGCSAAIHCRDPEVLITGPAGTGKSLACCWKVYIVAMHVPGSRILIVRKTRASLTQSILVTLETQVFGPNNPTAFGPARQFRSSYKLPNGSEIVVGGLDNADRIMSTEFDMIYVAEATELVEEEWEKLSSRLRNYRVPYQQIIGDCNPNAPTHWLKKRCDRGNCTMVESRHEDNPLLIDQVTGKITDTGRDYLARLDALSGVRYERLRLGKWVAAEGVVYEAWDTRVHLIDRFDLSPHMRRIRAIDYGYSNPFVCLWIAVDADGRMFIYRYIYKSATLFEDHAKEVVRLTGTEKIETTIADHDAEGNATLQKYGVPTTRAQKAVLTGIEAVQARLRPAGDGVPRLFLMRDSLVERDEVLVASHRCFTLEQEFDLYSWPKSAENKPIKENPVPVDDHALDALRYGAVYLETSATIQSFKKPTIASRRRSLRRI